MHAPPPPPPIPVDILLAAYRSGIFPMADARDETEIFWVEPRERAIIPLDGFPASTSLRKLLRQQRFEVTCNRDFAAVVDGCAEPRPDGEDSESGTWISHGIEASYTALHQAGHAHSIEVWREGGLVGGLYGVDLPGTFCGESMFSRADNASKIALAWLVAAMRECGKQLLDCQFITSHLRSLGAQTLSQDDYLTLLRRALKSESVTLPEGFGALEARAQASGVSPGKLIAQSFTHTS
ncbi:leucyl/phenylalanyl-tRNA--protein transferase [Pseudoblastomonas halimionae]|uniref:Leucyl/phenylalanyl-tRNA--protein transferase n=1 Tax=Alteriqipengyuania halimionae TaxID=1926630 RepID=A0A6I4TYU4_9SPHN|nr:leucyl/phenylalanyl-tRNA--protein transferase [Alteriqipengyuania halimionae]MXP08850.1 leucyl/phenylalanyl-tRNA--protein transferase [Alteriqipengyuania halimionae]